jgi:hypothetical protein
MKFALCLFSALALVACLSGCGSKEMKTSEIEKAIQAIAPPPAAQAGQALSDPVRQVMDHALAAVRTNDYVEGAVALQTLRSSPSLNADQLTAVQDAMATLQKQLAERADRGDPKAKQALDAIRTMRRR